MNSIARLKIHIVLSLKKSTYKFLRRVGIFFLSLNSGSTTFTCLSKFELSVVQRFLLKFCTTVSHWGLGQIFISVSKKGVKFGGQDLSLNQ